MNEIEAYLRALQALRPLIKSGCELRYFESALDLVASAISEAHKKGREEGAREGAAKGSCETAQILMRHSDVFTKRDC